MNKNKLYSIISNNLQQNSNNYSGNEIFGLLSILVLLEITEIFQEDVKSLPDSNTKQSNPLSSLGNIGNLGNLTGLLSQLQGSGNGDGSNTIQQMLPLLMGALGGNNDDNNLDIGKISNLINSMKNKRLENDEEQISMDNEEISNENNNDISKKKVSGK